MYIKIIYSILKYICNNPLFEISNTIEIKIIRIKVKTWSDCLKSYISNHSSNKNISHSNTYIYIYMYNYILSTQHICDSSLFFTLNQCS